MCEANTWFSHSLAETQALSFRVILDSGTQSTFQRVVQILEFTSSALFLHHVRFLFQETQADVMFFSIGGMSRISLLHNAYLRMGH